jgi:hypothetical protein
MPIELLLSAASMLITGMGGNRSPKLHRVPSDSTVRPATDPAPEAMPAQPNRTMDRAKQAGRGMEQGLRRALARGTGRTSSSAPVSDAANVSAEAIHAASNDPRVLRQELSAWVDSAPKKEAKARAAFSAQLDRALDAKSAHFETCCKGLSSLPSAIFAPQVKSLRLHNMQGISQLPTAPPKCGLRNMALQGAANLQGLPMAQFRKLETLSVKGASKKMTAPNLSKAPRLKSAKFGGIQGGDWNVSGNPELRTLHIYGDQKMQQMPKLCSCPQLTDVSLIGTPIRGDMTSLLSLPSAARVHLDSKKLSKKQRADIEANTSKRDYQGPQIFFGKKASLLSPRRRAMGMLNAQLNSHKVRLLNHFLPDAVQISKTSLVGQKLTKTARKLQQDPRIQRASGGIIRPNMDYSLKPAKKFDAL